MHVFVRISVRMSMRVHSHVYAHACTLVKVHEPEVLVVATALLPSAETSAAVSGTAIRAGANSEAPSHAVAAHWCGMSTASVDVTIRELPSSTLR